jgi:hypothetical protein
MVHPWQPASRTIVSARRKGKRAPPHQDRLYAKPGVKWIHAVPENGGFSRTWPDGAAWIA